MQLPKAKENVVKFKLMQKIKVAINGFGRIGRLAFRLLYDKANIELVAVNDLTAIDTLARLLQADSVHGRLSETVTVDGEYFCVGAQRVRAYAIADLASLPWAVHDVDVVIESTGISKHLDADYAKLHLSAGAKKVLLSAPAKKGDIKTIVLGVNEHILDASDKIVSNASCTTNCLSPMLKVLHQNFGIKHGLMNTIHAYTSDQRIHDAPHADLRRARAGAINIVPTSTGANKAVSVVLPELAGKIEGASYRVPVIDGSLVDLVVALEQNVDVKTINHAFEQAANGPLKGIMAYSTEPLVSTDILTTTYSCTFDSELTQVNNGLVRVVGWYDNEYGYAARLADMIPLLHNL